MTFGQTTHLWLTIEQDKNTSSRKKAMRFLKGQNVWIMEVAGCVVFSD